MTGRISRFFNLARKVSKESDYKIQMGAVIVKGNRILSKASNKLKFSTRSPHPHHSLHAEINAILSCKSDDLRGASIFVYREHKDGTPAMSKPCEHCMNLIRKVGIDRVYFVNEMGISHRL